MKKKAEIVADDGENKIKVSIEFQSRNGLARWEVRRVIRQMVRRVSSDLPNLLYTDFGIENTKVHI